MSDVALIRNPTSTGNRAADAARRAAFPSAVQVIDCSALEDMTRNLREAHASGAEVVLIDGGDGTVREVLSRLPAIWGPELPQVGIFARGNTNLIAREVGRISGADAVNEILRRRAARNPLPLVRRSILRLDYAGAEHPTLRGFMIGWGAYETGSRIAREEVAARGPRQVGLTVLSTIRRAFVGAERQAIRRGVPARLTIDGRETEPGRRLIGLATTLQGPLVGGLRPFWGEGPEPIRWFDVVAPGRRLALAAPFVLMGRPRPWMARAGYHSGRARRIEVALEAPFIMDGEIFPAPTRGPLTLSAGEVVSFISL